MFRAFADPVLKARWYAHSPGHETLSYLLDFQVDGAEVLCARMLPGTPIAGSELCWTGRYLVVEPQQRITFCQTLDMDGMRLSAALVTIEFAADGEGGTGLTLTHQAAYFAGADGPAMRRMGWQHLLDAVEASLVVQ